VTDNWPEDGGWPPRDRLPTDVTLVCYGGALDGRRVTVARHALQRGVIEFPDPMHVCQHIAKEGGVTVHPTVRYRLWLGMAGYGNSAWLELDRGVFAPTLRRKRKPA
jgi:hypothetical protein